LSIGDDSGGNRSRRYSFASEREHFVSWTTPTNLPGRTSRGLSSATPLSSRAWSAALVDQRETADDLFVQNAHQVPRLFIAGADLVPQGLVNGAKLRS
jgi:hypothetical protein